jgi:2-keto-4-pentenoate hydratase/2-oxohepta-3-ene-1,7-dioic acid hydratase in catechol pathway
MRIARCRDADATFWGIVDSDAQSIAPIPTPFADWAPTAARGQAPSTEPSRSLEGLQWLPPVEPTNTVLAAGATYAKHVAGIGLQMPKMPAAFLKPYQAVIGHEAEIQYPAIATQWDYEAELVVVLSEARRDNRGRQGVCVLGYTVGNDVSDRAQQFSGSVVGMDMFSAKGLDGSSPIGPWIVTRDEFGDGHPDLAVSLTIDGETRQSDRTSSMAWGVPELLDYIDARSALRAGDLLFTGTPAGVGHEDGRYLEPGQVVEVTVEGVGTLRNRVGDRLSLDRGLSPV